MQQPIKAWLALSLSTNDAVATHAGTPSGSFSTGAGLVLSALAPVHHIMGTVIDRDQALPIDQHLHGDPVTDMDRDRIQFLQGSQQGMQP